MSVHPASGGATNETHVRPIEAYRSTPNIESRQGQTNPRVGFLWSGRGNALFVGDAEAVLALKSPLPSGGPQFDNRQFLSDER